MKKSTFGFFLDLLKANAGWRLGEDKYFIIDKKVYNFIREKGISSVESLIHEIKSGNKTIINEVVEALAMSDTCFYRDYSFFQDFENHVLPHIKDNNRSSKKLRVWSLGCSTGQEAYSIAIGLKSNFKGLHEWDVDIIGTDISTAAIAKAQKGAYSNIEIQTGLNARTIIDNFHLEKGLWQANSDIAGMIDFRRYNALEELTFMEKFDIIFARNVLRFFDKANQVKLIGKIHQNQTPNGFLCLGVGEDVKGLSEYYEQVQGLKCIYQPKRAPNALRKKEEPKTAEKDKSMPTFQKPSNVPQPSKRPIASDLLK